MSGSPEPLQLVIEPGLVCVVDASALIGLARRVDGSEQSRLFSQMTSLVRAGQLAFPRQVADALASRERPVELSAWTAAATKQVIYPEPSGESVRRVLSVAQLADPRVGRTGDSSGAYVAAMALEVSARPHQRVVVATDDVADRMPAIESLATGCWRLGLDRWTGAQFAEWVSAFVSPG